MAKHPKVAVIGAGIIGTSAALLALQKIPNIELTIISEKFTPYTTGDGSSGFLFPYLLGDIPNERKRFWLRKTFEFCQEKFFSPDASDYGIGLLNTYMLSETPLEEEEDYKDIYHGFRPMTSEEMSLYPSRFKFGVSFNSYYAECRKLLPLFLKQIQNLGGKIIKRKVHNFEELHGQYDVAINCSGLGAAELVPDSKVTPIRGQVIRVRAPWLKYAVMSNEGYVFPNSEEVIVGGTSQFGNWNLDVDLSDRQTVWENCKELVPSIEKAEVIRDWVGLRPGRTSTRLERETVNTKKGELEVIHNYGHGGSGVTTSWGCAHEVVGILEDVLNEINFKKMACHL